MTDTTPGSDPLSSDALAAMPPGVYAATPQGAVEQVHLYQGGEYALTDIPMMFELGTQAAGEERLVLDRSELRQLKVMADAQSFDHPPEFIEMCLEVHRFALTVPGETVTFVATF